MANLLFVQADLGKFLRSIGAVTDIPEQTMPEDLGKHMLALLDEAELGGPFWATIGLSYAGNHHRFV
jgi:hypothetical protein